ncbi:hypothetical protein [Methylobacterium flocculans]|uniref:hypothetical protein n=1 Tax=Methylobacterium flocculans TaxID=2984843 RepID=UPI0021F357FD|nr:hypothetical protein [Methylobacterium sp. FF17]
MDRIGLFRARHPDGRGATLRLRAARRRFERSTLALRKAALDHIDAQVPVDTMLKATLDRLAARACGAP